jgi:hypothetical protein
MVMAAFPTFAQRRPGSLRRTVIASLALLLAGAPATTAEARVVQRIGTTGTQALRYPEDVALAPTGDIFVLDHGDRADSPAQIKVYGADGTLVRSWNVGRLSSGGGVPFMTVDRAGTVFVGAAGLNTISAYSAAGQRLASWPVGDGPQDYPVSLTVDAAGHVVAAEGDNSVETFDAAGHRLARWPQGSGNLATGTSGTIYRADEHGIDALDATGRVAAHITRAGAGPGRYQSGRLVAGPAESLYVVAPQRIQKFGRDGAFLGAVARDRRAQSGSAAIAADGTIYSTQWLYGGRGGALLKLAPITTVDATAPSVAIAAVTSNRRRARVTYRLSEEATLRVSLKRRAATRDPANRDFGRYLHLATLDLPLAAAGTHTLVLDPHTLAGRRLRPGDFAVALGARDDAGNESPPARKRFSIRAR